MPESHTTDRSLTVFFLVKTTPEWLGFTPEQRRELGRRDFQPLLDEFREKVRLKWYDVEFYNARVTDVWMVEASNHLDYQMFCEKLRETPFWDRYFRVEEILPGEENAWAKNYQVEPFRT
jgi:hypothetical protein